MLLSYPLLFGLEVAHGYFADPRRCRLEFQPDAASAAWLAWAGCVLRPLGNQLKIYYEAGATPGGPPPALAGQPATLRFAVRSPDPMFGLYTAALDPLLRLPDQSPPAVKVLALGEAPDPVFDMARARQDPASGAWVMRGAAPTDASPPSESPPATAALDLRWGFQILVPLTGDPAELGRLYRVLLDSRAVVWKYILTGDWLSDRPRVQEASPPPAATSPPGSPPQTATFEQVAPDGTTTADGQPFIAFRSTGPIPLRDRPDRRFELWSDAGDRPLIAALPSANPANLALAIQADPSSPPAPSTVVCEIFVSR